MLCARHMTSSRASGWSTLAGMESGRAQASLTAGGASFAAAGGIKGLERTRWRKRPAEVGLGAFPTE